MFKTLSFSFENDFQRLQVELDVFNGAIHYRVPESKNVDFVQKNEKWNVYEGDFQKWAAAFGSLDIGNWNETSKSAKSTNKTSKNCNIFPESEVKWSLSIRQSQDDSDPMEVAGKGSDSYPVNFTDLLELLKQILNLPVLLLEL